VPRRRLILGGLILLTIGGSSAWFLLGFDGAGVRPAASARPASRSNDVAADVRTLETRNSAGRSGSVYLPVTPEGRRLRAMVLLHGSGGSGAQIVSEFSPLAQTHGLALIAPDSRFSPQGLATWQVADRPGETTPDLTHVEACVREVEEKFGAKIAFEGLLVAGHSAGASMAAYVATRSSRAGAFAVLHGGVFASGLGKRRVRAWVSTGSHDGLRPPTMVKKVADDLSAAGLTRVLYREFLGGHGLTAPEKSELIAWWLGE
jgi:phospholipase/carboxylesterase